MVDTCAERKEADSEKTNCGECADLSRDAVEPVECVDGECDPEDSEDATEERESTKVGESDIEKIETDVRNL